MNERASVYDPGRIAVASACYIFGIFVLLYLIKEIKIDPTKGIDLADLGKFAAVIVLSIGSIAVLRFILSPLVLDHARSSAAPAGSSDSDAALRGRIAPFVLTFGGVAILLLALTTSVALGVLATSHELKGSLGGKIDTILMAVFSSTLPVFATWVGTVLAFYFSNESFKQAAQAAREASSQSMPKSTAAEKMIPYNKIVKLEVDRAKAGSTLMADVIKEFSDQVTRVVMFDKETRQAIYVIRKKSPPMPTGWLNQLPANKTIDDYRQENGNKNAQDSTQFGYVSVSATQDEARMAMKNGNCVDLFVTATGGRTEQVLGWLTDDILKAP